MAEAEETDGLPTATLTESAAGAKPREVMELIRLTKAIDGDVLVLRCGQGVMPTREEYSELKVILGLHGLSHCVVVILPLGIDIERLNDEAMMLAGWRRIEHGTA